MAETKSNAQVIPTFFSLSAQRYEPILFWFLCGLHVLPIWLFRHFPSQDGPIHLSIADMLMKFHKPEFAIFHEFFNLRPVLEPNLLIYGILLLLRQVAETAVAEKSFLTLYAIGFAWAARYAIAAVNPRGKVFSLLFLPFVMGQFIHMGFYNFCFSFVLFLVGFGYWWRHRCRMSLGHYVVLGLLGLLTTLAHLIGFVMLTLVVALTRTGTLLIAGMWTQRTPQWRSLLRSYCTDAVCLLGAYLPALTLVVAFFLRNPIESRQALTAQKSWLLPKLAMLSPLYSFRVVEGLFFVPMALLVWSLCLLFCLRKIYRRHLSPHDSLLFGFAMLCLLYFLFPGTVKNVSAADRFLPFMLFTLVLWFASNPVGPVLSRVVVSLMLLVSLTTVGYRIYVYNRLNDVMAEYLSVAPQIAPHTSLLALHFQRGLWHRQRLNRYFADPFLHLSSIIALERGGVDLRSAIISPRLYGYFPLVYRGDRDPFVYIGEQLEESPPVAQFLDYPQRTGASLDYVLTWRLDDDPPNDPHVRPILSQLQEGFRLIYVSPQHGLAKLWARNPS